MRTWNAYKISTRDHCLTSHFGLKSVFDIHFSQKPKSQCKWTFIRSIHWMRQSQHGIMFFLSCVCYAFVRVCLYVACGHLLGKGWPLGSRLWCLTLSLSLSHWYPGSGVVLDCTDSWYLHPYLLFYLYDLGHVTKMDAIPMLGKKNSSKLFSRTKGPMTLGFGVKHWGCWP